MIAGREDREIAETFFNSITRRVFATVGVDPGIEFVSTLAESATSTSTPPVWRTYSSATPDPEVLRRVLLAYAFRVDYEDLDRDARHAAEEIAAHRRTLEKEQGGPA